MAEHSKFSLSFLGGAGTVTGSKYLVSVDGRRYLIDCGLFQGLKELRLKNWQNLPIDAKSIDAVILTHAHIDHSGYLPKLVQQGFRGPIYATQGTFDLASILLPDSAHIMEEEAEYANREGYSKHHPALPLFTSREANLALSLFRPVEFRDEFKLSDHVSFELHPAGHILGSSFCLFHHRKKSLTIGFSGDLGRPNDALMKPPAELPPVHYLVLESTYGDRLHPAVDPTTELQSVVETIIEQNSVLIIPAFAVGRTQEILYYLARLREQGRLDGIGVYLDSPMASQVSELYWRYHDQHKLSRDQCEMISSSVTIVRNAEQSMALLRKPSPKIIISASGMATGGRVLHHLRNYLGNPNNVILFTGFQAEGTRGRQLVDGQDKVKIHGRQISVAAQIKTIEGLSAHADQSEILAWLKVSSGSPRQVFVTHGEKVASVALAQQIEKDLLLKTCIPELGTTFDLT